MDYFLLQPSGYYNAPAGAAVGKPWPVCTIKPVRKGNKHLCCWSNNFKIVNYNDERFKTLFL
jgi:hypothetical protein